MTNHGSIDVDVTIDGVVNGTVQEGSGGGTRNYERLTNKPQINDVELVGNKSLEDLGIVNNEQPDWEQHDTEAGDYIKNKPSIPEYLKDLESDVLHRTVKDSEIVSWNQKSKVVANPGNTSGTLASIGIDGTNYAIQGGGGGGAVDSVNGKTGDVILNAEDVGALPDDTPLFSGNYDDLTNKPTIPDDLADLNDDSTHRLVTDTEKTTWNEKSDFSGSYNDLSDKPTIPDAQVQSDWNQSDNTKVDFVKNKPTLGTAAAKDYATSVIDGSADLVTGDAVHDAIDNAVSSSYHHAGVKTCAELVSSLLVRANEGNVYNITDSGTTTADFIEGAGKPIAVGSNVGIAKIAENTYKFDLLSGVIDTSTFIEKSSTSGLMKNDGSIDTNSYATTSQIPDITGKADKVTSATSGNFAGLDANGNLIDSGHKHSDYLTQHQDISGKADKVTSPTNGNIAGLNASGNLTDSGISGDMTTTSASGNPISIADLKSAQIALNPIITFEPIQAGSGTPSPSNVRAISGYDKIEVLSGGKNLFDKSKTTDGKRINNSGEIVDSSPYSLSDYIPVKSNTTYYFSHVIGTSYYYTCALFTKNKEFIDVSNIVGSGDTSGSISMGSNVCYIRINILTENKNSVQVEEGSTATTYVPYNKTTDLSESLGQTVYGGTLDVRTGKLTVDRAIVDMGDLSWTKQSYGFIANISTMLSGRNATEYANNPMVTCSMFATAEALMAEVQNTIRPTYSSVTGLSTATIVVFNTSYTDGNAFKTAVTGQKLVYPLATPIEIQLTPHEIALSQDYAYLSTNGTLIQLDYHNGELATHADVEQLAETVNELGESLTHVRLNVNWGNVSTGTVYSYNLTSAISEITPDTFRSISIMCAKGDGASTWDARGTYNYRSSSDGKSIVLQYECAYTQNSAVSVVDVLYQS